MSEVRSVGVIGARGHVAAELLPMLLQHPGIELAALGSRALAGQGLAGSAISYQALDPEAAAARPIDAWVLALPNGEAAAWAGAIAARRPDTLLIDLSADHRFDDRWRYGLPELKRAELAGARRIANPGCYATGIQLAIAPFTELLDGEPEVFGVSGYSGAGTTPSPRNDPARLEGNLMPYALTGHLHEREASRGLGRPVRFVPHVAGFFRGISLTVVLRLAAPASAESLRVRAQVRYAREPLVRVVDGVPELRDAAGRDDVTLGGFAVSEGGRRAVLIATLDNLKKGAATQAVQNLNLALGFDELAGIKRS